MALPIASRDLVASPLTIAEMTLILNYLVTNASGTAVNMVTGIGTVAPAFFAGLAAYVENHRSFASLELSPSISAPRPILKDQYGNNSVLSDGLM